MSAFNLDAVLRPRSVAVIGASERAGSLGRVLLERLLAGGFSGPIYPVNPRRAEVLGVRAYPDMASVPARVDLAVVAIPAAAVPAAIGDAARHGARGAIVISAGFGEAGSPLQQSLLAEARSGGIRIVGPNTLGVLVPGVGLNASFAQLNPAAGDLAFVAQSGAMLTSVLDWAAARAIGFSHLVALGDMADVDFGDLLEHLAADSATRAVLLYVEAVTNARKFLAAARAAARAKPVIVLKSGRHARSAAAAASHTGRLAGPDAEYDAAFRRAGLLRVATLDEMFGVVETLTRTRRPAGRRVAIVSNGGGLGVLAADALLDGGGQLAALEARTIAALDAVLPAAWSHANPVDIVGDATAERYAAATRIVLDDRNADALLVLNCPTAVTTGVATAKAVAAVCAERPDATVVASWVGEETASAARAELRRGGVPAHDTPEQAVRGLLRAADRIRELELLGADVGPVPDVPDSAAARRVLDAAAHERREWLEPGEARAVLAAYGIPVGKTTFAASPREAGEAARAAPGRVALKICSPDIQHKSEVGGVELDLEGPAAVESAAAAMLERVRTHAPGADIKGFSVEPMIDRTGAVEVIIGASAHGDFGPVILFGEGGTAVEAMADTAIDLPPLTPRLAQELMARTRIFRRLRGYRDVPPVDLEALGGALVRVARLLIDCPTIVELDINPLLARPSGIVALDARIRLGRPTVAALAAAEGP